MAKAAARIDERRLKAILEGLGDRFDDAALARLTRSIRDGSPIRPPDGHGWDVGACIVTAGALVTMATVYLGKDGNRRRRRSRAKRKG
jgi:hypothetical protein